MVRSALCPLGRGSRNCVRKQMADREMMLVPAAVLWRFDVRLAEGWVQGTGCPGAGSDRERRVEYGVSADGFLLQRSVMIL